MATVQSLERSLDLLEALARGPAGISELAAATELPKSTVARLIATLESRRFVERTPADTRYRLGQMVTELGAALTPTRNLIATSRPHLTDLAEAVGEAAGIAVPDGFQVHYMAQVDSANLVQVRDWSGTRLPMHVVPSGIVLLADWPAARVTRYLNRNLERPTSKTVVDPRHVRAKLAAARRDGFAWVMEEFAEGINSVAAPVRNHVGASVGAIHVHGPAYRFPKKSLRDGIAEMVANSAQRISEQIGHGGD